MKKFIAIFALLALVFLTVAPVVAAPAPGPAVAVATVDPGAPAEPIAVAIVASDSIGTLLGAVICLSVLTILAVGWLIYRDLVPSLTISLAAPTIGEIKECRPAWGTPAPAKSVPAESAAKKPKAAAAEKAPVKRGRKKAAAN